jgi:hypothetical protein
MPDACKGPTMSETNGLNEIALLMQDWPSPLKAQGPSKRELLQDWFVLKQEINGENCASDADAGLFHRSQRATDVKVTTGEQGIINAFLALWPTAAVPPGLRGKVRNNRINGKLIELGLDPYSDQTIRRALNKLKKMNLNAQERS